MRLEPDLRLHIHHHRQQRPDLQGGAGERAMCAIVKPPHEGARQSHQEIDEEEGDDDVEEVGHA